MHVSGADARHTTRTGKNEKGLGMPITWARTGQTAEGGRL